MAVDSHTFFYSLQREVTGFVNWTLQMMTIKRVLESGGMLTDKHMYVAHKLLQKQFPGVQGCQSTLLAQKRFTAVSDEGISRVLILFCLSVF